MGKWNCWSNEGMGNSLTDVVRPLNPKAKQAMYGAATAGVIKRGTWDGCAFNKAGVEVDAHVSSTNLAAATFGLNTETVNRFIKVWDAQEGTDEECTHRLREALISVGLFSEPNEKRQNRILRTTVYKSQEDRMREEFENMVKNLDMSDTGNEVVADIEQVKVLLNA